MRLALCVDLFSSQGRMVCCDVESNRQAAVQIAVTCRWVNGLTVAGSIHGGIDIFRGCPECRRAEDGASGDQCVQSGRVGSCYFPPEDNVVSTSSISELTRQDVFRDWGNCQWKEAGGGVWEKSSTVDACRF
jgi:hypothetical protein